MIEAFVAGAFRYLFFKSLHRAVDVQLFDPSAVITDEIVTVLTG